VTVEPDGSSATVSATGAALPAGDSVVVATVAVVADLEGEATLNVSASPAPAVATTSGVAYTVSGAGSQGTTVTVSTNTLPVELRDGIPGSTTRLPPTNVDDDPAYEDLTGDGVFNFQDVIEFVFALGQIQSANLSADAIAVLDHSGDGRVDFTDVIDLVFQL
jgi:PKD repeat protein